MIQNGGADCLIISANQVVTPYPVYPIGAAYVVGALRRNGHRAEHFDMLADGGVQALEKFLDGKEYDLIGISIRNLDSVDSTDPRDYLGDIALTINCVRQCTDTKIVLGGPAFSILPDELMQLYGVDYGVVGEGENIMPWLASEIAAGRLPKERIFNAELEETSWNSSLLTDSTVEYYTERGGMLNVQTKRGCPYTCTYCSYPGIEGSTIRYRDPDDVAEEVVRLQSEAGAKYLFFTDSVFNDPEKKHLELAEALIRRKSSIPWCAFFRPSDITAEELRLLKRAGLSTMELGTDGATDETLAGFGKLFSFEDVAKVHQLILTEDIPCAHFIMFGGPNETKQTVVNGLKNIERLEGGAVFAYVGIRIFPDTEIFNMAVNNGTITADQDLVLPTFYYSPDVEREWIDERIRESFSGKMDRIYPCHESEGRIKMLHKLGKVGPLWDLLLMKGRRG